ncbi:testis-specific gene 10 protein isoform X2 [Amia ocellicauda]|uniref:testis-specific gene 10 protein isoform X2 n=1 Tax=Amia ocellicauda TaxID=2972642 RepID=UPI00346441B7
MDCNSNTEGVQEIESPESVGALERCLQELQGEKQNLSSQVEDLTKGNEQLCQELSHIDRLAQQLEEEKEKALETADKEVEEAKEAESFQGDLGQLQAQLRDKAEVNQDQDRLLDQLQVDRDRLARQVEKLGILEKEQLMHTGSCLKGKLSKRGNRSSRLDSFVRSVEEDRDFYKREADTLRRMLQNRHSSPMRSASRGRSPTKQSPVKGGSYDSELMRTRRERDELQAMMDKYERHMSEIKGNIKVLTADRDKADSLYQQAQEEIARLRREMIRSPRAPKSNVTAQSILRRVEAERDEVAADLRRMSTERDSLWERLKISKEAAISQRAHLEQRVEDLESTVFKLEKERDSQDTRQAMIKDAMQSVEEEVREMSHKAAITEEELARTKAECSRLRSSLSDTQRKLTTKISELQTAQDRNKLLDEKNDTLLREINTLSEEVYTLQTTVEELDKEKDGLQGELDDKAETISSLRDQLEEKEKSIKATKLKIGEMESAADGVKEQATGRERELGRMRRELDSVNQELEVAGKARETLARESAQLQEDLTRARLDNQALQLRLEDSGRKVEDLKLKIQDYVNNVTRTENLLASKEKEVRELQESQRRAFAQADGWEDKARQAEKEASSLRLDMLSGESERRRLKDKIESLEGSLEEALSVERACKSQVTQLNQSLLHLEEELRQAQTEKASVLTDLESTRELCIKLDASKEAVQRELNSSCQDNELLRKKLASERITMKNMELLLVSNQVSSDSKTMSQGREVAQLEADLEMTKRQLSTERSERISHSREVAQLEADLEMTKRQLSTERSERERAVQELRHQGLTSTLRASSPIRRFRASWSPERSYLTSPDRAVDRGVRSREF